MTAPIVRQLASEALASSTDYTTARPLAALLESFTHATNAKRHATRTRQQKLGHAQRFVAWMGADATVLDLLPEIIERYKATLAGKSASTILNTLSAVRAFCRYGRRLGWLASDPTAGIALPKRSPKRLAQPNTAATQTQAARLAPAPAATIEGAIALFLEHRAAANVSDHTIRRYRSDFRRWELWREAHGFGPDLASITIEELRAFFTYLRDEHVHHSHNNYRATQGDRVGLAPATIEGQWKLIHAAWVFWTDEELLTDRQMAFFARGRIPGPKVPKQIRPTYDLATIEALLQDGIKQTDEATARDQALICLLYDSGMRVAELCGIRDRDVDLIERQALVTGKGNKQRYIFWTARTAQLLADYLVLRTGPAGGDLPLFRSCGTGGRAAQRAGQALRPGPIRAMLKRRAARAGIELPRGAAVHALRHTFAHRFLDSGGDGLYLQQLLGHESIVTTMRYVRENPTGLRRTYRRIMDE